jgi:hypothetical protein
LNCSWTIKNLDPVPPKFFDGSWVYLYAEFPLTTERFKKIAASASEVEQLILFPYIRPEEARKHPPTPLPESSLPFKVLTSGLAEVVVRCAG